MPLASTSIDRVAGLGTWSISTTSSHWPKGHLAWLTLYTSFSNGAPFCLQNQLVRHWCFHCFTWAPSTLLDSPKDLLSLPFAISSTLWCLPLKWQYSLATAYHSVACRERYAPGHSSHSCPVLLHLNLNACPHAGLFLMPQPASWQWSDSLIPFQQFRKYLTSL
jgi:hypothetical protein